MRQKTHQILRFDWSRTRSFVIVCAFLRFGLASKATIINFEIRRRKQEQVRGSLVPNTLHDDGFNSGEKKWKEVIHTKSTMSPFTRFTAGMFERVLSRNTRHDGGIIARKDARMASDF